MGALYAALSVHGAAAAAAAISIVVKVLLLQGAEGCFGRVHD